MATERRSLVLSRRSNVFARNARSAIAESAIAEFCVRSASV